MILSSSSLRELISGQDHGIGRVDRCDGCRRAALVRERKRFLIKLISHRKWTWLVEMGKQNVSDQSLVLANIIDGRAYHLHAPILTDHHCIRWSTGERADMSRSRSELSDCLCLMDFSAAAETEKTIKLRNFVHMNLG